MRVGRKKSLAKLNSLRFKFEVEPFVKTARRNSQVLVCRQYSEMQQVTCFDVQAVRKVEREKGRYLSCSLQQMYWKPNVLSR